MAFKLIKKGAGYNSLVNEYIVDSYEELSEIENAPIYSTVFIIESGKKYIVDSQGNWQEYEEGGGSTGSGLPEITAEDEGKVLTVNEGEAVWGDAPSGLPEIAESDEGKFLAVVRETEEVTIIPEQSVTITTGSTPIVGMDLSGFNIGDQVKVTINELNLTATYSEQTEGQETVKYLYAEDLEGNQYTFDEGGQDAGFLALTSLGVLLTGTYTIFCYKEEPSDKYSAQWAEPSGGGLLVTITASGQTIVADASYNDVITALMSGSNVMFFVDASIFGEAGNTAVFYLVKYGAGNSVYGVQIGGAISGAFAVLILTASAADDPLSASME